MFQGREGTVFNPGQFNAVTFNGVPIDPPGTGTTRTLRFTNVRADAEFLQVSSTFTPQTITMSVSTNGQTSIGINISQQVVAIIGHGLVILSQAGFPGTEMFPSRVLTLSSATVKLRSSVHRLPYPSAG